MNIIDRRPNPKGKSLANRQRFIERAKDEVKRSLVEALKRRKLGEAESGEKISIPTRGIREPSLQHARRGVREVRLEGIAADELGQVAGPVSGCGADRPHLE